MSKVGDYYLLGGNETVEMLETLTKNAEGIFKQSVYKGAGVVADEMTRRVKELKTTGKQTKVNGKTPRRYCYEYEKEALIDNLGIAPMKLRKSVNTKVGFSGYYHNKSEESVPVPLLANSINAGTSFMKKQAFINATIRGSKSNCIEAMQKQLDKSINEITR